MLTTFGSIALQASIRAIGFVFEDEGTKVLVHYMRHEQVDIPRVVCWELVRAIRSGEKRSRTLLLVSSILYSINLSGLIGQDVVKLWNAFKKLSEPYIILRFR